MNNIGRIRVVGAFMAPGAYIRMAPRGVHRRVVMIDAGYWFIPMTLETGDPGPDRMIIPTLPWMTILTLLEFKDLDAVM